MSLCGKQFELAEHFEANLTAGGTFILPMSTNKEILFNLTRVTVNITLH